MNDLRFLTPTENKRLNELIGFLCITVAVLTALALISYSPRDAAWNVSASAQDATTTQNWIGPARLVRSDLLFQVFGFASFLLPMALAVLGWRWLKNQPSIHRSPPSLATACFCSRFLRS